MRQAGSDFLLIFSPLLETMATLNELSKKWANPQQLANKLAFADKMAIQSHAHNQLLSFSKRATNAYKKSANSIKKLEEAEARLGNLWLKVNAPNPKKENLKEFAELSAKLSGSKSRKNRKSRKSRKSRKN